MLQVVDNIAMWIAGSQESDIDVWFLPGFAESHLCFRDAFRQKLSEKVRIILFDLPGTGASPARKEGLTIHAGAMVWKNLIERVSTSRKLILVGHSVSGIIMTETVKMLSHSPILVVSVEGNLTKADAYFSGQAGNYDSPDEFYQVFSEKVLSLVNTNEVPMSYYASLQFADPQTLWVMGRSALEFSHPGGDFQKLTCSTIYYWSQESTTPDSQKFLANHEIAQRKLDGLGHWPMKKSPDSFYSQLWKDISYHIE